MKINGVHVSSEATIVVTHSDGREILFPAGMYEGRINGVVNNGNKDAIFDPLNRFLETLRNKDEDLLFDFYENESRRKIDGIFSDYISAVEDDIEDNISLVFAKMDLINNLVHFCREMGPLARSYPDLDVAGMLEHHTEERTYYIEDYVRLTALSFIAKILAPIFAKHGDHFESLDRAVDRYLPRLLDLIHPIVKNSSICYTYYKFYTMCYEVISKRNRRFDKTSPVSSAQIFASLAKLPEDFDYLCLSYVVCVRLPAFNPLVEEVPVNVAIYIDDGIKRAADTKLRALSRQVG